MENSAERAIAIVGVGAILPDAPNAPAFWNNILQKRYSIREVPAERWSREHYFDPDPNAPDKMYTLLGGWVQDFEFDWRRFRIPPKVVAAMDIGQQWALTIAAEALEDYGYPDRPLDTDNTGVIFGTAMGGEMHYDTHLRISFPEFVRLLNGVEAWEELPADLRHSIIHQWHELMDQELPPITEDSMPGELANVMAGRVANVLNLRGPNFITDAACASTFAALNAAFEMLTEHHVDAVLTGGVDRNMSAASFVKFCKIGALSATGSRPFGDGADGFIMGEGSASFLLKRLEDAERAGDQIYAVIRGVGGSSDGKGKGITAPNPIGQHLAVTRAWENAGLDPATATLVEAHGTSTRVGDVVEVESLAKVFGGAPRRSIGLGSSKSNIGHLKAGAGAAGLLKATMALHHKVLPPTLNATRPNPNIDWDRTPFYLIHDALEWQKPNGTPRRAGVSAYGFGGTNFHIVLEEYVPGMLTSRKKSVHAAATVPARAQEALTITDAPLATSTPPRGILAIGANTPNDLQDKFNAVLQRIENGWMPPIALPKASDVTAKERIVIDFGSRDELLDRLHKAQKAMSFDTIQAWDAFQAQGIFRGSGALHQGKVAFMFPGQGSQYVNMGRELAEFSPLVAQVFDEADRVMTPILGRPLTDYIFIDPTDEAAVNQAEFDLMQTAITQPAMLTLDIAIYRLLESYGFKPDMVTGHSLGEYAALIVADIMNFEDALEAAAARGSEMSKVSMGDNGKMAAILAPIDEAQQIISRVNGYVVPANINSYSQVVIGGDSPAVEQAVALFTEAGYRAMEIPVSHAFHTRIVAPASIPLRAVLDRQNIRSPRLPIISNVTGEFYPTGINAIKDLLQQQIASPVQWVRGLQSLYNAGARVFVEVGPKRALHGFAKDIFNNFHDTAAILTNHPKQGTMQTFNHALCALYAAGYYPGAKPQPAAPEIQAQIAPVVAAPTAAAPAASMENVSMDSLGQIIAQALSRSMAPTTQFASQPIDRNDPPRGSVIISGTGLGLPGAEKPVMDEDNALRILRGEQFIDLIPERFRRLMLQKRVTRLVKSEDGSGSFETLTDPDEVIRLAGRPGSFDLEAEYGVPGKLIEALDTTTQLAMAAGLDALREAGIPLVQTYRMTSTGKHLPDQWLLPESLRDETGVIFASAFPGGDRFVDEFTRYYAYVNRVEQLEMLEDLRGYTRDQNALREINRRIGELRSALEQDDYTFDRRFIFRVLAMGHSQFAQYIGARGPNTHVNAACASTTQAIGLAEDWIRAGRCRRVIVIGADNVTNDVLMEWIGAGFLATGAAATDDRVEEAALPFDRRRHGTILGMGACALVVESEDAVRERGMRGIVELLSAETRNSAFHGTRLDVNHISGVMNDLVTAAERRFGLNRYTIAQQMMFMSHETFTPARGGSASAEVIALRHTFGDATNNIIVANTKGFTGHPMGVGVEDVIAVKALEYGIVPPVPNYKEVDEELGALNLSRGGYYPVQYALHLAAGFGSQISMTLTRRIPGALDRIDNKAQYQRWLNDISGYDTANLEVFKRVLRVSAQGAPLRQPAPSNWERGVEPLIRARVGGDYQAPLADMPMARAIPQPRTPQVTVEAPPAPARPALTPAAPQAALPPAPPAPKPMPAPAAPVQAAPAPPAPTYSVDALTQQVITLVAQQTGYPVDMLETDLDLEADLGVDTVKQAEIFSAIRQAFNIPRNDQMRLRDYPTLGHVINFVKAARPELAASAPVSAPAAPTAQPAPAAYGLDSLTEQIIGIVAQQTGYPADMLETDLDLEADLGVDTVKQAEIFSAIRQAFDIPRNDQVRLRDYPTLGHVISFVKAARPDLAVAAPVYTPAAAPQPVQTAPAAYGVDDLTNQIIGIVADQTGYPADMLELDLDLEADLGVDTVKQAEIFAAVRQGFNIPRRDDLKLRDYPTLGHVVSYVREMRPDLAAVAPTRPAQPVAQTTPAPQQFSAPAPTAPSYGVDTLTAQIINIVASNTGYPADMLELDLDLEADLGVDTVKQAEIFAAVRQTFNIPRRDDLKLRDYPTLGHMIGFVREMRPDLAAPVSAPAPTPAPAPAPAGFGVDAVTEQVLQIVATQTGYPADMLELDLDLEADLGVDTVKQAEIFAAVRQVFNIPRRDDLKLRDYPTLALMIKFVRENAPNLAAAAPMSAAPAAVSVPAVSQFLGSIDEANRVPRRVVTPALRPALSLCKPTGVTLDASSRVIVMNDEGGVGKALIARLEKLGVTVLSAETDIITDALEVQLNHWLNEGAIQGVYWLPALDVEPRIDEMDIVEWRELNRRRVKNLYLVMRMLYESVNQAGTFLVSATRLGGVLGYSDTGASAPLGGAVSGFTKAYKRERENALIKVVDFEISRKTAAYADLLIDETLFDPGIVEVGYQGDQRYTITFVEQPAVDGQPGMTLNQETVFLVTGAAGGITSAIVADLAAASGGIFYLMDLTPEPDPNDPNIRVFRESRDALQRKLIDDARAVGQKPTMNEVNSQIMQVERLEAALRAVEAVQMAGGTPLYRSVNLMDNDGMKMVIDEIRKTHGRIDVLVHAGGLEISRSLPDKDAKQFNLVFDVKADGFFNILSAAQGMPIYASVVFSSVAGRFGNNGQTDYSAANDLLCKITSSFKSWRPETKGIAIDWTAWGGIGMATRGSIPKIMEMAGIDMLPPEAGIPTVRRELVSGGFRGEIVVGQRLGVLGAEWDETGGLDVEKAAAMLAKIDPRLLMVNRITASNLYGGLQVETELDPNQQAFLYDHQMDGTPLLPGVMGTESFAEIASVVAPGYRVAEVANVDFLAPFKFYRMEAQTLYLSITAHPLAEGEVYARAELRSMREIKGGAAQEKLHFTADVRLVAYDIDKPVIADFRAPTDDEMPIMAQDIYRVYFHGPAYQVLERVQVEERFAFGLMAHDLPPNSDPADVASLMTPRLIELCFQTAGIWEIKTKGRMALPRGLRSATSYRQPEEANGQRLYAVVEVIEDGAAFNAQVIDESGRIYVEVVAYQTIQLPDEVSL